MLRTDGVDRGVADARNIICIILETKNNMFKLGCKVGVLEGLFPFNTMTKTELRTDFEKENIPENVFKVREAIRLLSVGHGQGVLKCNCTGKCANCNCVKAKQLCNSRCHKGKTNANCTNCNK